MIHSKLSDWRRIPGLLSNPLWKSAFEWLELNATHTPEGIFPFGKDGFFARVMKYPLLERHRASYESHRHTVDIQYTLEGAEGIEVSDLDSLQSMEDYSSDQDVEHFKIPVDCRAWIKNSKGCFVILFPDEPHMPKLKVDGIPLVHKVVIKIPMALFPRESTSP